MSDPTTAATGSDLARADEVRPPSSVSFSFEQTQMGMDRTLMSMVRTSLSLISFGFTIYQVLGRASALLPRGSTTARNLGLALLILGLLTLASGVISHVLFTRELARKRERLHEAPLVGSSHGMAVIYISALSLLIIGLVLLGTIVIRLIR